MPFHADQRKKLLKRFRSTNISKATKENTQAKSFYGLLKNKFVQANITQLSDLFKFFN